MAKSTAKRPREAISASPLPSTNGVESDVSAVSGSPQFSSPRKSPSAAATPSSQSSTNGSASKNNDDPSTWSKSKKKRMRKKRREAERKMMAETGGSGGEFRYIKMNGSFSKESAATVASIRKELKHGSTSGGEKGVVKSDKEFATNSEISDRVGSKRQRKDPAENGAQGHRNPSASPESKEGATLNKLTKMADEGGGNASPKKRKKKKKQQTINSTEAESPATKESNGKKKEGAVAKGSTSKDKFNNAVSNSDLFSAVVRTGGATRIPPKLKISLPKQSQMSTLQKSFLERLTSSRFRELNEELYTHTSQHSFEHFTKNPELFDQYHVGFRKQAKEWPVNPVNVIFKKIVKDWNGVEKEGKKGNDEVIVADFGCGDAKLAERLLALHVGNDGQLTQAPSKKKKKGGNKDQDGATCPFKVHSFDLVSGGNPLVTPADISNVPLPDESVDIGVYSLALMGTNVADFVREAWRVLKFNGTLRVAEVRSRFETASAATGRDNMLGGGGKRAKLNNRLKHPRKQDHGKCNSKNDADDDGTQPLMLLDEFLSIMERCGFQCTHKDQTNKMFLFMDFAKVDGSKGLSEKERFSAKPCIYKRR